MNFKKTLALTVIFFLITSVCFLVKYLQYRANHSKQKENVNYAERNIGDFFFANIKLEGIVLPINVVKAEIKFEPEALEARDILTNNSFAPLFLRKEIDNTIGRIEIIGVVPNPGFSEEIGHLAAIEFHPKRRGITDVTVMSSSQILANNGQGMDVTGRLSSKHYVIK